MMKAFRTFRLNNLVRKFNFSKFYTFNFRSFTSLNDLGLEKFLKQKENKPTSNIIEGDNNPQTEFNLEDNIIEFNPETNWEKDVLLSDVPVVIDCYADWCAPCRKLYPKIKAGLEKNKNFKIVKINIDKNEELAEKLQISSIPHVFLVYKGNVVDSFVGLPDDNKINKFFESISLLKGLGENEQVIQSLLTGAEEFMKKKQWDQAENMFNEGLSHEKWRNKYGHIFKLGQAIVALNKNELDKTESLLNDIKKVYQKEISSEEELRKRLSLLEIKLQLKRNPDLITKKEDEIVQNIEKNPSDLQQRYSLAVQQFENERFEEAINTLLDCLKIDRNWNNKAAHNLLLQIFGYLGSANKLVIEGRQKLTKILY